MDRTLKLLLIEDSEYEAGLLIREIERGGYTIIYERVETAEAVNTALKQKQWDLIISDYVMPGFSGLDALKVIQTSGIDLPFIMVSGRIGDNLAAESMIAGAHDYILKDNLSRLVPAIKRELREAVVRRERRQAAETLLQSENRFRSLFEAAPMGIVIYRNDGLILQINHSGLQMFGLNDTSDLQNRSLFECIAPKCQGEIIVRMRQRMCREAVPALVETIGQRKDGSTFPCYAEITTLELADKTVNVAFINDRR
jgi:PAS domain S-box-containing protein